MDKIFVSIASYRDPETNPTINDLFNKAADPSRVIVGLCLQHEPNEIIIQTSNEHKNNIKIIEYDWRESQGTCWARHNIQKILLNDEEYYLQLDSHHRLCKEWDKKLIDLINSLKNTYQKPIIGGYCPGYKPSHDHILEDKPMKIHSFPDFSDTGDLMFVPKTIKDFKKLQTENITSIPARFLSGHFIFSDSIFCRECMYDPNMYFRGEELSLSARAYTSGYDLFHPTHPIVWHEYTRAEQKKHWDDHTAQNGFLTTWHKRSMEGKARARYLLGIEKNSKINFGKYGLGTQRSLHEYELYSGLKFETKQVHKYAYDIANCYPHAKVLDEKEWLEGLMQKYKIHMEISNDYLTEIKNIPNLQYISLICDNKNNICRYRKDIKKPEIHTLCNKYYIEASMEEQPNSIVLMPYTSDHGFLKKHEITNFRILS